MATYWKVCYMMQGSLAARLRLLRTQRGLTLQEASEQIGIDRHTLSRVERGTQTPHAPTLKKISAGYDIPVEELLSREEGIVGLEDSDAGLKATTTSPKDEAPSTPETTGEERRQQSYPYPWMKDTLAETLSRWNEESLRPDDPEYSRIIAMACLEVIESVLRFDVPAETFRDRMPEGEREERGKLVDWIATIFRRAQDHYVDSKEANPEVVRHLKETSDNVIPIRKDIA